LQREQESPFRFGFLKASLLVFAPLLADKSGAELDDCGSGAGAELATAFLFNSGTELTVRAPAADFVLDITDFSEVT